MNLLIVDDDLLVLKGISSMIPKEALGIDHIFCACRVQEAKKFFQNEVIDLLLCDIEMPMENGLELLSWLHQKNFSVVTMILTSHADFSYSRQAIRAGSIDYLLKPVSPQDLTAALSKAIACREKSQNLNRDSKSWKRVSKSVKEHFFQEVMLGNIQETIPFFIAKAKQQSISLNPDHSYLPLLFSIKKYSPHLSDMDSVLLEFTMKNIAYEIFSAVCKEVVCVMMPHEKMVILFFHPITVQTLLPSCCAYLDAFSSFCGGKLCGYLGHCVSIERLSLEFSSLVDADQNNVLSIEPLILPETWDRQPVLFETSSFCSDEWITMVRHNRAHRAFLLIEESIRQLEIKNLLNGKVLKEIQNDLLQDAYVLLKEYGIWAHLIFAIPEVSESMQFSLLTLSSFFDWLRCLLKKICQMIQFSQNDHSIVSQTEQYIKQNLDKITGCKEVAAQMYLTPDYLSRLFKEEKGITLQKYIQQEKMEKAKNLLVSTNLSISIVAQLTGYSHFSHFSMTFKKNTGLSPADYRKQYRT